MRAVLVLHVAAALFLIGPLTVVSSASARAIRAGQAGLPVLRWLHRSTRGYAIAASLVFLIGLYLVPATDHSYGEAWLSASMALFLLGLGLTLGLVVRDQESAIDRLDVGGRGDSLATRVAAASGASALIWLAILVLMYYRPGS